MSKYTAKSSGNKNLAITIEINPTMRGLFWRAARQHKCTIQEAVQMLIDRSPSAPQDWANSGFKLAN